MPYRYKIKHLLGIETIECDLQTKVGVGLNEPVAFGFIPVIAGGRGAISDSLHCSHPTTNVQLIVARAIICFIPSIDFSFK